MATQNVNYNYWVEAINKMDENDLLGIIQNSGGYNPSYIQLVKDRLIKDFHHSQAGLDDELLKAEVKYRNEKIVAETDRSLSTMEKAMVIVGLLFLQCFAVVYILIMRIRKKKNSLGEKHYLYNETARRWLLNCIFSFILIWGVFYVVVLILNSFTQ